MKKLILTILSIVLSFFMFPNSALSISFANQKVTANPNSPLVAIVIDDLGSLDRSGVEEMLSLDIPLTCAIMPGMENTTHDAEKAYSKGHEVIVHMPMEAQINLPRSWYGPLMIHNSDTPEQAIKTAAESIASVPHAVGMNIHIGTGVSRKTNILSALMNHLKERDMYFLDSKTIEDTMCGVSATSIGFPLMTRDIFLENHNDHSYSFAVNAMERGKQIAFDKGYVIIIGHVGPEGGKTTVKAIRDKIDEFKNAGMTFVKLSQIYELTKKSI